MQNTLVVITDIEKVPIQSGQELLLSGTKHLDVQDISISLIPMSYSST